MDSQLFQQVISAVTVFLQLKIDCKKKKSLEEKVKTEEIDVSDDTDAFPFLPSQDMKVKLQVINNTRETAVRLKLMFKFWGICALDTLS